jgi:CDP-diacylglycerol--serine O-phosphatidyltransferase
MPRLRRIAVLPSLFTLGNGICGFASIIVASKIQPEYLIPGHANYASAMIYLGVAGWLIFAGMLFDALDGRMARLAGAASRFGAELDSLCDAISFGAAPAFLLLKLGPTDRDLLLYKVLFLSATFYVICTILRLARFNVEAGLGEDDHRFFRGLPSPAAAGCLAAVAVMRCDLYQLELEQQFGNFDEIVAMTRALLPFAALGLSLLMVSTIPYPHLVNQTLRGKQPFAHLVHLLVLAIAVLIIKETSLVIGFWGFALLGPARQIYTRVHPAPQPPMREVVG